MPVVINGSTGLTANDGSVFTNASGNVGIGTSSPSYKLQVRGSVNNAATSIGASDSDGRTLLLESPFSGSGVGYVGTASTNSALGFKVNGTEYGRFDTSGNLGIGTTSPQAKLHAVSTVTINNDATYPIIAGDATTNGKRLLLGYTGASNGYGVIQSVSSGVAWTDLAVQPNGGNLLVGTTTAITSGLTVFGGSVGALSGTYNSRNTTMTAGRSWNFGAAQGDGFIVYGNNSGSFVSGVSLAWGGNSWTAQSDERTKDIIEPITGALAGVSTLRTVIGKYKTDEEGRRRPFLIAQDVQKVLPEVVTEQADEQKTLGIEYANMIPLLVAAIKELNVKVESLTAEIATLKGAQA